MLGPDLPEDVLLALYRYWIVCMDEQYDTRSGNELYYLVL
jgi:hypothetical protein